MTEYWVSQGNKWCDYCKIYIANNATSLRNHEFGQRHKENVAKRLAAMRKDNIVKEKEKQQALKDLERIEAQAKKSYEKDLAALQQADPAVAERLAVSTNSTTFKLREELGVPGEVSIEAPIGSASELQPQSINQGKTNDWTYDERTGYHFNAATGYYYDPNSSLYYSDILGKWSTQDDALKASQTAQTEAGIAPVNLSGSKAAVTSRQEEIGNHSLKSSPSLSSEFKKNGLKASSTIPQGSVTSSRPIPSKGGRGVSSSVEVGKRKREDKAGPVTSEEAAALAEREAARRRTQEREKSLLGLYQAY